MLLPNRTDQQTVQEKLKLMTNYDADRQFMAASDLAELVQKSYLRLGPELISRIIDALLGHLKEESTELHGNAIKCLSKIIPRVPIQQCRRVCNIMINNIISPTINREVRDIYGTCVKTIINDVQLQFGQHVNDLLKLAIQKLVVAKNPNTEVEQELVDIVTSFIKKWPSLVQEVQLPRQSLLEYLLRNITLSKEPVIRRRSYVCLGVLAGSLNKSEFKLILADKQCGLLSHLALNHEYERKKVMTLSVLAILKGANQSISTFGDLIYMELLRQISDLKGVDSLENFGKVTELLEISVQCMTQLIRICQGLIVGNRQQIAGLSEELLEYSPCGEIPTTLTMNIEEEEEDDDYLLQDQEDQSWRVRRAAIQLAVQLAFHNDDALRDLSKSATLYKMFGQKQPQVIGCLVQGFQDIFNAHAKSATINSQLIGTQRPSQELPNKETLLDMVTALNAPLYKILSNLNLHQGIGNLAAKLISSLGRFFSLQIARCPVLAQTYIQNVFKVLEVTKSNQVRIDLLNFYQSILKNLAFNLDCPGISQQLLTLSQNHLYKVSASAFKALHGLLSTGRVSWFDQIGQVILRRLRETDIDYDIKTSVIGCASQVMCRYTDQAPIHFIEAYLEELDSKLPFGLQKRNIVSAIGRLNRGVELNPRLVNILCQIIDSISKIGLRVANNVLKIKSCQAIQNTLVILGERTPQSTIEVLLERSKELFNDRYYPQFLQEAVRISPSSILPYLGEVINLKGVKASCIKIPLERGAIQTSTFLQVLEKCLSAENIGGILDIVINLDIDVVDLQGLKDSLLTEQLMIGCLGAKRDPNNFQAFMKVVTSQTKGERIKLQASTAMGLSASGNIQHYLPVVLKLIQGTKDNYLFLNCLKHMIVNSAPKDQVQLIALQETLFNLTQGDQSELLSIAECIGHIVAKNPTPSLETFIPMTTSKDKNTRFLASSSYRYFISQAQDTRAALGKYIRALMGLLTDESLRNRSSSIKSLTNAAYYTPDLLVEYLDLQFLNAFNKLLCFDESLVEIVSYGSSKEKIDRGKVSRLDGFTFYETLLDRARLPCHWVDVVVTGCIRALECQTSVDVILSIVCLLKKIGDTDVGLLLRREPQMVSRLGVSEGKLKEYKEKRDSSDSKVERIIGTAIEIFQGMDKVGSGSGVRQELEKTKRILSSDLKTKARH